MNTQELQTTITLQLTRRGLPKNYAERTASELADHHHDLIEELSNTGLDDQTATTEANNRLGDQQTIIKKAVREYQRRHWCGRWPLLTFLFGPVVLLITTWIATILFLAGLGEVCNALAINMDSESFSDTTLYVTWTLFEAWFVFLLPMLVALLLTRKALQAAMGWGWIALAALMLSWAVGTTKCDLGPIPASETIAEAGLDASQAQHQLRISAPLMAPFITSFDKLLEWYASDYWQLTQLLLPLLVTGAYFYRSQQLGQRSQMQHAISG